MKDLKRLLLKTWCFLLIALVVSGCGRGMGDANSNANANSVAAAAPGGVDSTLATNETPQSPAAREQSLVSISAGALVVKTPDEYGHLNSAIMILDENPKTGWATHRGVISPQAMVIELAEQTVLSGLEFDTAEADGAGRAAREISVEMSNMSATDGFKNIANVSLVDKTDNQKFSVSSQVAGRWIRLTVKNNHGSTEYLELFDFRATGKQLTSTPVANVSGTYSTNWKDFHLKQEGTSVSGCYQHEDGVVEGGIEGRVIKFTWIQKNARGPAVMVFSSDGKQMYGLWWYEGKPNPDGVWYGQKKSNDVGTCGGAVIAAETQIAQRLETAGRARIYGINFETDSDAIKEESKPTLDKVAAMLKAKPDWKITIEGHTDSTSTPQHNQDLSERRATAVKNYLQAAGIDASRLTTAGLGALKPVVSNDSALGRAQNRRVELVRQ